MTKEQIREKFEEYKEEKKEILASNDKLKYIELKKTIRPLLRSILFAQRKINGQTIEFINKDFEPTDRKIVFVLSHIGKWDFEIVNEQIKNHFHVIASDFMNMYGNINGIFMNCNGVVFVDIDDPEDRKNSEKMMMKILEQDNMMILPEGTWNLSENEIIRDTHLGAVSIALEKNAIIVPISVEQYDKRFVINVGKNFDPQTISHKIFNGNYQDLDDQNEKDKLLKLKIKIETNKELRDRLATLKYEIWEKEPITKREDIPYDYWTEFINDRRKEWPGYSMDEQIRNGCFPPAKKQYNNMLEEISKMKINKKNEFLFIDKDEFLKKYGRM